MPGRRTAEDKSQLVLGHCSNKTLGERVVQEIPIASVPNRGQRSVSQKTFH